MLQAGFGEIARAPSDPFQSDAMLEGALGWGPGKGAIVRARAPGVSWGLVERRAMGQRVAIAYSAPHWSEKEDRRAAWQRALDELASSGAAALRMNFHASIRLDAEDARILSEISKARGWGYESETFVTFAFDLARSPEDLWKEMHYKHRKRISEARDLSPVLRRLGPGELDVYLGVAGRTFERQGLDAPPESLIRRLYADPEHFRFYAVTAPNVAEPGGVLVVACDGVAGHCLFGGSGDRAIPGAGNWLHWEVALDLQRDGFRRFDLGGARLAPQTPKDEGIRRFKERFGAPMEERPAVEIVFRPKLYAALRTAHAWTKGLRERMARPKESEPREA